MKKKLAIIELNRAINFIVHHSLPIDLIGEEVVVLSRKTYDKIISKGVK